MDAKFSQQIHDILSFSREEAIRLGNEHVSVDHLFLGLLRYGKDEAIETLIELNVDLQEVKAIIEKKIINNDILQIKEIETIPFTKGAERTLKMLYLEARSMQNSIIDSRHLLLAVLRNDQSFTSQILEEKNNISYDLVKDKFMKTSTKAQSDIPFENEGSSHDEEKRKPTSTASNKTSETPVLDNFGIDLTRAAAEGKLDPIVGRETEIERIYQILSRRKKNNPILIGEPGVGKSAIAEGLALRIHAKKVSRVLFNKRVITLDVASIVAGTKYRGQFEERMKAILNELVKNDNIILFIDEIHTIVGAGGATGSLDAANMLKPALARGEIQCIGATTLDEYRQYIEKDGALERRFQKVIVEPTSTVETIEILKNIKDKYEDHHNVLYTDEAIKACVTLTNRYISDRHLPDKAIDALDESGSRVHISNISVPKRILELEKEIEKIKNEKSLAVKNQSFEEAANLRDKEKKLKLEEDKAKEIWERDLIKNREVVDEESVAEVVAMMTGVPVKRIAEKESSRLLNMYEELRGKIIGQDQAVKQIVKAIQRNRAGLKDPEKPIGTFVFLGPTGVGKTQLAKKLAEFLFDNSDNLIRIDMSEYMEKFAVSRLVGAPPGYVGYEEGGQLTEKVRRKPYSVVLLDEMEKAHPDVFHLLLQVLDEGRLTDSLGRRIDFRNTILIMTSNIGSRDLINYGTGVGFGTATKQDSLEATQKGIIDKALRKTFAPEFLNRIDDVIMFNQLTREDIHQIIDIELNGLYKRVDELGYKIKISTAAKDYIADKGFDSKYGARPLKRAIQKYLEDKMAEAIIKAEISEGDTINVGFIKKTEDITVKISKNAKIKSE